MKIKLILGTVLAFGVIVATPFAMAGRGDYETPDYEVTQTDGAFEIRDYPELVVASVAMKSESSDRNSAFMNLFRYISGKNNAEQKIAMTTPVITSTKDGKPAMSFVVPEEVAKAGAPQADNSDIVITKRKAGRFATFRYSGRWTKKKQDEALGKLTEWMKSQGLKMDGDAEKASYDPPFTLPALRRNEVMVRIAK